MIVRPAGPDDIPAMAAVTAASYRAGFAGILEEEALALRSAPFFADRFAQSWPRMRVAADGARVAGVSLVTDNHIDMFFVDPAVIGRGVGALLLAHIEKEGARTLECFRDNRAARRFYERHGWRLAGEYEREFIGCPRAFVAYEKDRGV